MDREVPTCADLLGAAFQTSRLMLEWRFCKTTSAEPKLRFRGGFTERTQNGQRVSARSPIGAPDNRGAGNVLAEKRGEVCTTVGKCGLKPGLRAVRPSLMGVRRVDRDVEGSLRIDEGRGEYVRGPEVSARDEARNLSLGSAVAGQSRSVGQGTTGDVGGVSGSAGHRFTGPGAAQALAYRINVLLRFQHSSMMRVEAPHPCVIDLCVAKFLQQRVSPQEPSFSRIWSSPPWTSVSSDEGLDLQAFARQEMFIVSIAIVGSDAAGVLERWRGQILHGIHGPRECVVPESSRSARASSS